MFIKYMLRSKLNWYAVLLGSSLVLVWRLIDFVYEAADGGHQMTRVGLALKGRDAEVIELAIILGSILLIWKAISNILRLHRIKTPK